MAYDESLAARVRDVFGVEPDLEERKMFGGLAFMLCGHMCCGVVGEELMLRLGADAVPEALRRPFVRPMDFTGRPMKSMVYVAPWGLRGRALRTWVEKAAQHAKSLPSKA
jgi:hypothetical protein